MTSVGSWPLKKQVVLSSQYRIMASNLWLCGQTLVAVAATLPGVWGSDPCEKYSNGCSTPFHLPMFYKATFTPSCNKHDVCYRCGAAYGIGKDQCDSTFLRNMEGACAVHDAARRRRDLFPGIPSVASGSGPRHKRSACTVVAKDMFYAAVQVFGDLFYHDVGHTESYCSDPVARGCLGL